MQNFPLFSLCMNRKVDNRNSESNVNIDGKRFSLNEFFRSHSRTNLCITQQDLYKYSQQCQDYFRSNCMCCNGKVTPEKVLQQKELNGTPVIPINLSPEIRIKTDEPNTPKIQQISTVSSPSVNRTNSTILLASTDDPDDEIVYEYSSNVGDSISNKIENGSRISVHSNASSKKSVDENLDESSPLTVVLADETYHKLQSNSRSVSVSSAATTKSFYEDPEHRPSTRVSKSNASSASIRSANNRSRNSLAAEESIRPISNISRATSNLNEDDSEHEIEDRNVEDQNPEECKHENINHDSEIVAEEEAMVDVNKMRKEEDVGSEIVAKEEVMVDGLLKMRKEEDVGVEHHQDDNLEKHEETGAVHIADSHESVEAIDMQAQLIISDNESSSTTEAVDEVDFVKDRSDEHTTSTVSSVQNFSVRPRFRKRKVSPTKAVTQINARPKIKDQHLVCLQQLDSSNWDQIMIGLQTFVDLMRNNPEQLEPQLHQYCLALSKNIKNLRSQVSRASCQAAGELFESHSKLLEQEADDLALALLNRTADTNKFLRSDATKALKIMCETLPIPKVIQIVTSKGATHQNAIVRTASANLCNQIVARCGTDKIFSMNRDLRDKLILTGANLLLEGSLDTRNYAKMIFKQLSHHPTYQKTLQDVIPTRTYRNIEKTLKTI